jgi:hypothetical protein
MQASAHRRAIDFAEFMHMRGVENANKEIGSGA